MQDGILLVQHVKPLAILGWGETGAGRKTARVFWSVLMESYVAGFDRYRDRARACYSDQGTERLVWVAPAALPYDSSSLGDLINSLAAGAVDPSSIEVLQSYLCTCALHFPGHLHMLFNAFRKALEALPHWKYAERPFRSLDAFCRRRVSVLVSSRSACRPSPSSVSCLCTGPVDRSHGDGKSC